MVVAIREIDSFNVQLVFNKNNTREGRLLMIKTPDNKISMKELAPGHDEIELNGETSFENKLTSYEINCDPKKIKESPVSKGIIQAVKIIPVIPIDIKLDLYNESKAINEGNNGSKIDQNELQGPIIDSQAATGK